MTKIAYEARNQMVVYIRRYHGDLLKGIICLSSSGTCINENRTRISLLETNELLSCYSDLSCDAVLFLFPLVVLSLLCFSNDIKYS